MYASFIIFFFIVSTMFLQKCSLHNRTANKLCGLRQCCVVLCDHCFLEHAQHTGHTTALFLSPISLNFFTTFTGYTHYKAFEWADTVRRCGMQEVFAVEGGEYRLHEGGEWREALSVIGVKVLQEYQTLTQNNRQFVLNNKNSQQLLHPEFLTDIFNLATEKWQSSAEIILSNLAKQVEERFKVGSGSGLPKFNIQEKLLNSIQSYKMQLLAKNQKQILLTATDIQTALITVPSNTDQQIQSANDAEASNFKQEQTQMGNYELPYSIKQIQSFEEIGERGNRAHNTMCSIANDPSAIQEVEESLQDCNIDQLKKEMEELKLKNAALHEENCKLKDCTATLEREKNEIAARLQALERTNKENQISHISTAPKGNYILKIPARVLSIADPLAEDSKSVLKGEPSARVSQELFVRKVRVVK